MIEKFTGVGLNDKKNVNFKFLKFINKKWL